MSTVQLLVALTCLKRRELRQEFFVSGREIRRERFLQTLK